MLKYDKYNIDCWLKLYYNTISNQYTNSYLKKGGDIINKYIGEYTIFYENDLSTNKQSLNKDDCYLKARYNIECYRYDKSTLALYFPSGNSTANTILPKLNKNKIKYSLNIHGEYEHVYHVSEKDIDKLHTILKFTIRGKNDQLKEYKQKLKEEKLKAKQQNKKQNKR